MKVKFLLEKESGSNLIKYPDDISSFSNTEIGADGYMYADYSGDMTLENGEDTYAANVQIVTGIRKITTRSFMRRFTLSERTAIRVSADAQVVDIHEDLKSLVGKHIDLDHADTVNSLAYLELVAILAAGRPTEILVDGTQEEV